MSRIVGVLGLVVVLYVLLVGSDESARSLYNHQNLAGRFSFYGVLTLGVAMLIISGGIDLSIGSVVGLSAVATAQLLQAGLHPLLAVGLVLGMGLLIGLIHGLLVTKLNLQPFLVTLCGLFAYRGIARQLSNNSVGVGDLPAGVREAWSGTFALLPEPIVPGIPGTVVLLALLAAIFAFVMHATTHGRCFYAVGHNEQAARYAGIPTDSYRIAAYMWCSLLASLGGVLELADVGSADPTKSGTLYELYAITGAVLGGCSLRGGEGNILGILLGSAVLPLLRNLINFGFGIDWLRSRASAIEYTVIGLALLLGTIADEMLRRRLARSS
jgi:ribose transport system permease protein